MDPRVVRTRARLQEAFFQLAKERGFDQVSISDIVAQASVNRSTFYQHYSDKETLLADALDMVAEQSGASLEEIDPTSLEPPAALVGFLSHVDEYADLYRQLFTEPGSGVALARVREHVLQAVLRFSVGPLAPTPSAVPPQIIAAGVAGTLVGVIGAWLTMEDRPPAQVAAEWTWFMVIGPAAAGDTPP